MDMPIKLSLIMYLCSFTEPCIYCEEKVYGYLFHSANYTKHIRPAYKPNDLTIINVSLIVSSLVEIEEKDENMDIMGSVHLLWNDIRLKWKPEEFGNLTKIVVPALDVWLPDVAISNSDTTFYDYSYKRDFNVIVHFDGYVSWNYGGKISTNCEIDMSEYPFDTQNCSIHLDAWRYDKFAVDFQFSQRAIHVTKGARRNALWQFNGGQAIHTLVFDDNFGRAVFMLSWKRRHLYYYFNIFILALLMIWVALGSFWLPAESGERVSLTVTILLSFTVFLLVTMENTPVNSIEIPLITVFVILMMCVTTSALFTTIFLAYVNATFSIERPPKWARKLCFRYLATIMCMKLSVLGDVDTYSIKNDMYKIEDYDVTELITGVNTETDKVKSNSQYDVTSVNMETDKSKLKICDNYAIKKISNDVDQMLSYINMRIRDDEVKQEWIAIGRTIDRLMFWFDLILLTIILPLIFMKKI